MTGGSQGLMEACAHSLAQAGARVAVAAQIGQSVIDRGSAKAIRPGRTMSLTQ